MLHPCITREVHQEKVSLYLSSFTMEIHPLLHALKSVIHLSKLTKTSLSCPIEKYACLDYVVYLPSSFWLSFGVGMLYKHLHSSGLVVEE